MGMFCVNFHFRTQDQEALAGALSRRGVRQYHIFPTVGEWTSVCEQRASEQDDQRIRELAGGLSADLHVPAIAFLVHDSDIACYWLFENGQLVDEYNSCPDYFEDVPTEKPAASGGQPHLLVRYCRSGIGEEDVAAILGERPVFAEDIIAKLADALGIDSQRALADYRRLDHDGEPGNDGGDEDDSGPRLPVDKASVSARLAQWLGIGPEAAPADPKAVALVQAAVSDDTDQ
ncbi:MAG TPA: hypothetical protein VFA18_19575, partial [Gemmataceae bacterium]|nr:hypothetical protein [Gemmataceae bacterium]